MTRKKAPVIQKVKAVSEYEYCTIIEISRIFTSEHDNFFVFDCEMSKS
jgi:hypothetical protein